MSRASIGIDDDGEETLLAPELGPDLKIQFNHDLMKAMDTLKPIERQIVYLHGAEGFSMAEIAVAIGLTENAVKLRAHRAYASLRKIL